MADDTCENNVTFKSSLRPKRRFPGPAGVLPPIPKHQFTEINRAQWVNQLIQDSSATSPYSNPGAESEIENSVQWAAIKTGNEDLINLMNIDWILKKYRNLAVYTKIPFLCIRILDCVEFGGSGSGAGGSTRNSVKCVRVGDETATMMAAFDAKLISKYPNEVKAGSCVTLRNINLFRLKSRLALTITEKNLLAISYEVIGNSPSQPGAELIKVNEFDSNVMMSNYKLVDGLGNALALASTTTTASAAGLPDNGFSSDAFEDDDEFLNLLQDIDF